MRSFLFAIFTVLWPLTAISGPATLDEFKNDLAAAFQAGGDYSQLEDVLDPLENAQTAMAAMRTALQKDLSLGGQFVEMFRLQNQPDGARIIGSVITADNEIALYIALVLLRMPDGWLPVNFSLQSDYEKLLKYH